MRARHAGSSVPSSCSTRARTATGSTSGVSWHVDVERGVTVWRVVRVVEAVLEQVEADGPHAGCVELDRADLVGAGRALLRGLVGRWRWMRIAEVDLGVDVGAGDRTADGGRGCNDAEEH